MFNVLIVCTANVCRSPLGEAILKKMVEEENLTSLIKVQSCGIWGMDGQKPSELSEQVAMENSLDISQHQARSIRPEMVRRADLILCMTPNHKKELIHFFPSKKNKIFTLKEFSKKIKATEQAIADPIGMSLSFYRLVFRQMETEIKRIFPVLKQLAEKKIQK